MCQNHTYLFIYLMPGNDKNSFNRTIGSQALLNPNMDQRLLLTILNSKRLLSDHIEVLDRALLGESKQDYAKARCVGRITLPLAASVISIIYLPKRWQAFRCLVPAAAAGYFIVQLYRMASFRLISKRLIALIAGIDKFDVCIRRNINYFREIACLTSTSELMQRQCSDKTRAQQCLMSVKQVIVELFHSVRFLEKDPLPSTFAEIYENMEDLCDSEFFQIPLNQLNAANLKDLYNIYSYVQSQLLTRLGLMIVTDAVGAKNFFNNDASHLINVLTTHICSDMAAQESLANASEPDAMKLRPSSTVSNRNDPLSVLRSYSWGFSSRMLAVASECRHLDNILQNAAVTSKKDRVDLIASMEHIENSLSLCSDDYQRLILAYHKFLSIDYNERIAKDIECDERLFASADATVTVFNDETTVGAQESEFFVLTERTEEEEEPLKLRPNIDDELRQVDAKVIKQQFRPVLRQLRSAIGPINKSMRDRERKFLEKQGIRTEETDVPESVENDSDDSDTDEMHSQPHAQKTNRYDEFRQFLQNKQQISFLPAHGIPSNMMINEEILE